MSHEQQVDPAEAHLNPLDLLRHRLGKQQAALHNLMSLTQNTVAAITADISYSLSIIEAIEAHLPAKRATDPATVAGHAPGPASVSDPVPHLPAKRTSPIALATADAQNVLLGAMKPRGDEPASGPAPTREPISASGAHRVKPTLEAAPVPTAPAAESPLLVPPSEVDYLGHFFGPGSIFAKFLSPTVFNGGRGFVAPEYAGLKQYAQNITTLSPRALQVNAWPNGFYRDEASSLAQLYLHNTKVQVILTNLPHGDGPVYVSFTPFDTRTEIRTLTQEQLAVAWAMIHSQFLAIVRAAGDSAGA